MKKLLLMFCLAVALSGCSDRAEEMYETAAFEEKQFNREHARALYGEIVEKYPDSPYAARAKERLEALAAGE